MCPIDNIPVPAENFVAPTVEIVAALLADQHPDLANLPISELACGWDNCLFRVGDELVLRAPHREVAVPLIVNELRWLPELAPRLSIPVPVPIRAGTAACGYSAPWLISRYFPGTPVGLALDTFDHRRAAVTLADFFAALHLPAPAEAPRNAYRGTPLAARDEMMAERLETVVPPALVDRVAAAWAAGLLLPEWSGPRVWLHGDVHPLNVLCLDDGTISAIVELGDLCGGDPASDLAAAWSVLDSAGRAELQRRYRPNDSALWGRARAWAVSLGIAYMMGEPVLAELGERTLHAALADD